MQCCPDDITPFTNATSTDIPYYGQFGEKPNVVVMYSNAGVWTQAGVFTLVQMIGSPVKTIHVDHGGASNGLIRLS